MLLGNAPFYLTGYGTQLKMIGDRLIDAGYPVGHAADFGYSGSKIEWEGRTLYPHDKLPGTLNADTLKRHISSFKQQHGLDKVVLWSLGDTWKFSQINKVVQHPHWICMTPVDADRLDLPTLSALSSSSHPASISEYGSGIMASNGLDPTLLPHFISDEFFKSIDREYARASAGIPDDAFVVGYFGDLSMRKSPYETVEAFARFAESVPNAVLLIKGSNHINGLSMKSLLSQYNLDGRVIAIPSYDSLIGFSDEEMAKAYACMDVFIHASAQEGFGIMQAEAQACGVLTINTDFGCMKELQVHEELSVVPQAMHRTTNGAFIPQISAHSILEKLIAVTNLSPQDRFEMEELCRTWALGWSGDKVWEEYYQPLLDSFDEPDSRLQRLTFPPRKVKKVGFVSTFDTTCGIATYTAMLGKSLQSRGLEVVVFAESEDGTITPPGEPLSHDGIEYYRCWDRKSRVTKPFLDCLTFEDVDVLHFQHEWQLFKNTSLFESVRELPFKKLATYHTPEIQALPKLLAVTDLVLDVHITHWPETSQMLPLLAPHGMLGGLQTIKHGILEHSIESSKEQLGVPSKVPLFFTFGFASGSKGLDYFVEAAIEASKTPNCPYFEVVISMSPHPHWSTKEYIEKVKGLAEGHDFITILDQFMSEEDIDVHASAADYLVFGYRFLRQINSASGAVRRAIGHCKPVLVTDEGRLRDLAGGIHGWKFGQYDQTAFAKAIVDAVHTLGTSKYDTYAKNIKELVKQDSWSSIGGQHHDLYETIGALWSVVPEPMRNAVKVQTEEPYPELMSSQNTSSAGPILMRDNELSVEEEIHSQMMIADMVLEENPSLLEDDGGEEE